MKISEAIEELESLKTEIHNELVFVPMSKYYRKAIMNRLNGVIIGLKDYDNCHTCPVADKLDRLTEAIEQGYMIAEDSNTPFKISCIEREIGGCLD